MYLLILFGLKWEGKSSVESGWAIVVGIEKVTEKSDEHLEKLLWGPEGMT